MQTEDKQETERQRRAYYSFAKGMMGGAVIGLLLGLALAVAFYYGWFPLGLLGQFFASGIYPALISAGGVGLALGGLLGALAGSS